MSPTRLRAERARTHDDARAPGPTQAIACADAATGNRALALWLSRDAALPLEAEADRAAAATVREGVATSRSVPPDTNSLAGQPLDRATRARFEDAFGHDFSQVRVHQDAAMQRRLQDVHAHALTEGTRIGFAPGAYRPDTPDGQRRLAHELAHVVQQRGGVPAASGRPGLSRAPAGPQADTNRDALNARLKVVRERLATLRAQYQALNDEFAGSVMSERLEESLRKGTADLHAQARSESAGPALWGGTFAIRAIRKAASATVQGQSATINARLELSYLALKDKEAEARAATDIPRIDKAIRDVWQVKIANGEYAGMDFKLVPAITWRRKKDKAAEDAFQIEVRGPDKEPSSGDSVHGSISLAPAHLEGSRVIVVAHELAHVFGFTDAYLKMEIPAGKGKPASEQWSVGRGDAAGRTDLLGMIDPVVLQRLKKKGAVTEADFQRQSGTVHIWEEDASTVLRTFGVAPPPPKPLTIDDDEFDPGADLQRIEREGEGKLARIRKKRRRADNAIESLDLAEAIMKLEAEEKSLDKQLGAAP
ncbi:hypothetical protein GCM10028796_21010 [Ramlibacter monticola]|uniref:DUF4157 domain-containing protein n=1 Tax=Ramlibacter monticola TaxID=1926872 RepID=A0A936Z1U3_9BURK|nr:DUF4157 domain-containing protein [Ramlibacter monticola]MBL0392354.1 DUF4157 domain-containing protein [Ramlibacter monticola]